MSKAQILDEVLDEIVALPVDDVAKARLLLAIYAVGRRNGIKSVVLRERQEYAVYQLSKGVARTTIRDRLVRTYGVCPRQADRVISDALQLRHFRAENVRSSADNESHG